MCKHQVFVIGSLLFASAVFAQHSATGSNKPMPMDMASHQTEAMDCNAMMQTMQKSSQAMDDRLQPLVDAMNSAAGSAKVDRTSEVINELVSQRKQIREQMMTLMPQMVGHMMGHMQSGTKKGMSLSSCPMMKGSAVAAPPPGAEHQH